MFFPRDKKWTLNGAKKILGHIEQCQGDMKDIHQHQENSKDATECSENFKGHQFFFLWAMVDDGDAKKM